MTGIGRTALQRANLGRQVIATEGMSAALGTLQRLFYFRNPVASRA